MWLCDRDGGCPSPSCEQVWEELEGKHLPESAFVRGGK